MKKFAKKYLIAHKDNEHKPHILRGKAVAVIGFVAILLFAAAFVQHAIITGADFAAVISSVLVDLTNGDRNNNSVRGLTINSTLSYAAELKARDMAQKSYFAHTSPEGITPWYWFGQAGYTFLYAGENLAVNFSDSLDVEKAWMSSPSHRENILSQNFSEIGIATAAGIYKGRPTTFVVQLFGSPLPKEIIEAKKEKVTSVAVAEEPKTDVLGSTASEELFEVIESNETFAAVDLNGEPLFDVMRTIEGSVSSPPAGGYASILDIVTTAPKRILYAIYGLVALFIGLALSSYFIIEIKRHHIRHILYGVLLLIFIAGLMFASHSLIYADLFVR